MKDVLVDKGVWVVVRVLVTGAAGRLGTQVASHLSMRHEILATDVRGESGIQTLDVRDPGAVLEATRDVEAVVHLAGLDYDAHESPVDVIDVNVLGTVSVLEACRSHGIGKVVVCSSVAALGLHERRPDWLPLTLPITEEHPTHPVEVYSVSKAMIEIAARAAAWDLRSVLCIRPVAIVFPGKEDDFRQDMLQGSHSLRDFIAAADVSRAIEMYLDSEMGGYECVNLASDDSVTDRPILDWMKTAAPGFSGTIDRDRYFANPFASLYSNDKAKKLLNWYPEHGADQLWPDRTTLRDPKGDDR